MRRSTRFPLAPALLVCLATLLAALPAAAADWLYRVRPGDNLWDLSALYLKPDIGWERLGTLNAVTDPYALPPGRTLRMPVPWLRMQPAPAHLLAVEGQAQVLTAKATLPAVAGMPLQIGSQLHTGAHASATVQFADGSQMQLREDTQVRFDRLTHYGATGMVDTGVHLETGRILNEVKPARGPAARYIIDTPNGTSSVRGTRFRVAAGDLAGHGATEVLRGRVAVTSDRRQHLLLPGQAAHQARDHAPAAEALLPAPTIAGDRTRLDLPPYQLAWQPVPGAAGYRVEAVEEERPQVLRHAYPMASAPLRLDGLQPGRYRLLVRAISASGIEGEDAEVALEVSATPEPPMTLTPVQDQQVAPQPRFEWAQVADATATRLQLARDRDFSDLVLDQDVAGTRLRPPAALANGDYYWRLASRAADGHFGPFGQPRHLQASDVPATLELQPEAAKGQLTLRWQAAEPGQRYHVQLARDPQFRKLRLDQQVDRPQVSLKRPWYGSVYVRVQTLDDDGYAAPYSQTQQVKLPCRLCYGAGAAGAVLLLAL